MSSPADVKPSCKFILPCPMVDDNSNAENNQGEDNSDADTDDLSPSTLPFMCQSMLVKIFDKGCKFCVCWEASGWVLCCTGTVPRWLSLHLGAAESDPGCGGARRGRPLVMHSARKQGALLPREPAEGASELAARSCLPCLSHVEGPSKRHSHSNFNVGQGHCFLVGPRFANAKPSQFRVS